MQFSEKYYVQCVICSLYNTQGMLHSAGKIELIPRLLFVQFHLDSFDRHPAHSLALDPAHILMTSGLPKTGPVLDGVN